jgi:putative hemolysin
MDIAPELVIISCLIVTSALLSAAEAALISVNEFRLKALVDRGSRRARMIQKITADSTRFFATIRVAITFTSFFTAAIAATHFSQPLGLLLLPLLGASLANSMAFVIVTIAIAFVSLVLGELVPKRFALHHAEQVAMILVRPINFLGKVIAPLVRLTNAIASLFLLIAGSPTGESDEVTGIDQIKATVDAAHTDGSVGEQERRIIYGAVELSNIPARAIMVPRVQIQYLKDSTSLEEAFQIVSENAHTRLPVCIEDLDRIIGILYVKDLIRPIWQIMEQPPTVRELVRTVRYVSEDQPASEILRDMQKDRLHMVIVKDEFGGTAGLVTLEDVLEEIVGEIRDEYDAEEEREFHRIAEYHGIFKIRASISTVNNELNVQLPRDEVATLAGLFLGEIQRPPIAGDRLEIDNILLEVLEDGQRVMVSLIERDEEDQSEGDREPEKQPEPEEKADTLTQEVIESEILDHS